MADYEYLVDTGVIIPDTGNILADVQAEYKLAFGQDLNVDPSTPQGILINAEAIARSEVVNNNAALANQINPNIAGGVFLDGILALTGSTRNPSVHTTVVCTLQGVAGTIVPEGTQVSDTVFNEVFESLSTVTLTGSPAVATVTFRAVDAGSLAIAASTVTQILTPILGWDTVTNPAAGIPGSSTQSDAAARQLRTQTLFEQGSSLPGAIISAVSLVEGVTSLVFRENVTDAPITISGVTLVAHSIYLCVKGGDDTEVATAILSKKSGGCNYNGSTTIPVVEPASGQTYNVTFDRPTAVPVVARITVSVNSSISDPTSSVQQAILNYAAGLIPGEPGFVVNGNVSIFELAGAINYYNPGIFIHLVEQKLASGGSYSSSEIVINLNQIATIDAGSITVIVS